MQQNSDSLVSTIKASCPHGLYVSGNYVWDYGKPALLTAINRRLYVTVSQSNKLEIVTDDEIKLVNKAVQIVQQKFKLPPLKIKIEISSELPSGRHVGSSAAVAVATVAALTFFLKKIWNPQLFNELAYEVEKLQHGNPSGGDNSICTFGGFIWYRKELEFLKSIWQLPLNKLKLTDFYLIDTGRPKENTGEMVFQVAEFLKKYPQKAKALFDQNEEATKEMTVALKNNDRQKVISAMKKGEQTLEKLGVVSKKIIPLIREIENDSGAAKILGGGGNKEAVGLLLSYQEKTSLAKICQKYNYPVYEIKLGEEGVRREKS